MGTFLRDAVANGRWEFIKTDNNATGLYPVIRALGNNITGIEIGLREGVSTLAFLESCPNLSTLIGIDPFVPYYDMGYNWSIEEQNEFHDTLLDNMSFRGCSDRFKLIRKTSLDAAADIADNSIDFIYVDGEHTDEMLTNELNAYWPKLKSSGVMSGHDYGIISGALHRWYNNHISEVRGNITQLMHQSWYFGKI